MIFTLWRILKVEMRAHRLPGGGVESGTAALANGVTGIHVIPDFHQLFRQLVFMCI